MDKQIRHQTLRLIKQISQNKFNAKTTFTIVQKKPRVLVIKTKLNRSVCVGGGGGGGVERGCEENDASMR